jgi:hypothetical protein
MVFHALLFERCEPGAGSVEDERSSAGAEVHTNTTTDHEEENLPPVPPVTALLKDKQHEFTPGTPGKCNHGRGYRG